MTKTRQLRPPVSVVIPTYQGQKLLEKHLPAVMQQLRSGDEIVVVDDASPEPDQTLSWLHGITQRLRMKKISVRAIQHRKNQRFAAAVNTGVEAARHTLVWLLNNDVSPLTKNSVGLAAEYFTKNPNLFALGCAEVTEETPDAQLFGRGTGGFVRGLLLHWYDPDQKNPKTLWTAGGSMFLSRTKFQQLSGMDTLFAPAYEEDRDLSYRALKRGWHIQHAPEILVLHQHETTNTSALGKRNIQVTSWKNQFTLVWKNISEPKFLLQHILWLPYHLTVSNWKERGAVGHGFWRALKNLPQIAAKKRAEQKNWQRTDAEILLAYGSKPHKNV